MEEFGEKKETKYNTLLVKVLRKCWETEWHLQKHYRGDRTLWLARSEACLMQYEVGFTSAGAVFVGGISISPWVLASQAEALG